MEVQCYCSPTCLCDSISSCYKVVFDSLLCEVGRDMIHFVSLGNVSLKLNRCEWY